MRTLANLPKLEKLTINNFWNFDGEVFKYFTALKIVESVDGAIKNIKEGICHLMKYCKQFKEIALICYPNEEIMDVLKTIIQIMRKRDNDIPLTLWLFLARFRISPVEPKNEDSSQKILLFEIFKADFDCRTSARKPFFRSKNEKEFLKNIAREICHYNDDHSDYMVGSSSFIPPF